MTPSVKATTSMSSLLWKIQLTCVIPKKNGEKLVGVGKEGVIAVKSVYELLTVLAKKENN